MMRVMITTMAMLAISGCSASVPAEHSDVSHEDENPAKLIAPVPMTAATVGELVAAFDANEVAAMRDYGGGPILVTGMVRGVVLDVVDNPAVLFESGRKRPVQALFDKERGAATAELKKGKSATVVCADLREVLGNPILDDCWVDRGSAL